MKYDMIFGNQGLFSVAPTDATAVWVDEDGGNFYYKLDSGGLHSWDGSWHNCVNVTDDICFSAMRRIIQEPKRWTVEDQKSGRLPEVGCSVLFTHNNFKCEVIAIDDSVTEDVELALRFSDGSILVCKINKIKPIETSEEKAARLRSEWINKAYVDFHRIGCELEVLQKEQIKQIYDALLSGELTIPCKVGE